MPNDSMLLIVDWILRESCAALATRQRRACSTLSAIYSGNGLKIDNVVTEHQEVAKSRIIGHRTTHLA